MGGASRLLTLLAAPLRCPSALRIAYVAGAGGLHCRRAVQSRLLLGFSARFGQQVHSQASPDVDVAREEFGRGSVNSTSTSSPAVQPWPEWVKFVDFVVTGGYSDGRGSKVGVGDEDSFVGGEELGEEFVSAAEACLRFARDRPELLRSLTKKDIQIVIENCSPFLFRNGGNSTRRLHSFLNENEANYHSFGYEMPGTIDIMRYLLSNVWHSWTKEESYSPSRGIVEAASRKLFAELVTANSSTSESLSSEFLSRQTTFQHEQFSRPHAQNIEMKKGDWICPRCSFMNFARNIRCLECNEARPKRVLTSGEWECPQCEFFNYGRNMSCLRCDCRRPVENVQGATNLNGNSSYNKNSTVEQIHGGNGIDSYEIQRKLAANDEKAERWFSKMSQLGDTADLSNAADDEDFPEIMPMRKGVNRFVVSTRKTPLERRLSNDQNNVSNSQSGGSRLSSESISQSLDRILGHTPASSGINRSATSVDGGTEPGTSIGTSNFMHRINKSRAADYDPFVPLPSEMFSKTHNGNDEQSLKHEGYPYIRNDNLGEPEFSKFESPAEGKHNEGSFDTAGKLSNKVAEHEYVTDIPNAKSDDDFQDIFPMRKGENNFVISKKKDRSFTAPHYKTRIAMEQVNNSNFVPFVPFPSDYFAKKDKPPENSSATVSTLEGAASGIPQKMEESKTSNGNLGIVDLSRQSDAQSTNNLSFETSISNSPTKVMNEPKSCVSHSETSGSYSGFPNRPWNHHSQNWNSVQSENTNSPRKDMNQPISDVYHNGTSGNYSGLQNGPRNNQNQTGNRVEPQDVNYGTSDGSYYKKDINYSREHVSHSGTSGNYSGYQYGPWNNKNQNWNSVQSRNNTYHPPNDARSQSAESSPSSTESWTPGKSLEGSAVSKEPDPLDMSQEAKAQRWFRRVAQIKDISELANIPDEDFPDIMPMRKGVNRFVVSKRKTPLERRLTSPQYRKNLPIISSEPEKDSS